MSSTEMPIFTRTFDFISWLLPVTNNFPRAHRHTVTRRLLNAAFDPRGQTRTHRVVRGGAFNNNRRNVRAAYSNGLAPWDIPGAGPPSQRHHQAQKTRPTSRLPISQRPTPKLSRMHPRFPALH